MPKYATNPPLYDSVFTISIKKLKEWGYLKPNQLMNGTITWSINGNETGRISIKVCTTNPLHYIELDYKCNNEPINYKVYLRYKTSNLGKGELCFFLCPQTGKLCRKLYLIQTYFWHRDAFKGCMYEKQIQSKYYRSIDKTYGDYFDSDKLYDQLYKKHFKTHYKGRPTKKYKQIMNKINRVESIPYSEIEALYVRK
jgi:hypothetical protein